MVFKRYGMLAVILLFAWGEMGYAQPSKKKLTVLQLQTSVTDKDLLDKQYESMKEAIQNNPDYVLLPRPSLDVAEMMLSAGCVELDAGCAQEIGKTLGADYVLYGDIQYDGSMYAMSLTLLKVEDRSIVGKTIQRTGKKELVPETTGLAIEEVLGTKAIEDSEKVVAIKIFTIPRGAKAYLDQEYLGETPLQIERKPGKYTLRLTMEGQKEILREIDIVDMPLVIKEQMEPIEIIAQTQPETRPETMPEHLATETPWYKTWWFWTIIGTVVVGGTVGTVLGVKLYKGSGSVGTAVISLQPGSAQYDNVFYRNK